MFVPGFFLGSAAFDGLAVECNDLFWFVERFLGRPAEVAFREENLVDSQRTAVRPGCVVFIGAAVGDVRARDDERGAFCLRLSGKDSSFEAGEVVDILDMLTCQ